MIKKKNIIYIFVRSMIIGLIGMFIVSCEGYSCAKGFVYDSSTKVPIDSVLCEAITGRAKAYTDSLGAYEVCNIMGGCVNGCKDITVRYSKKGYKTKEVTEPENASKIYLDKE